MITWIRAKWWKLWGVDLCDKHPLNRADYYEYNADTKKTKNICFVCFAL